MELEVRLVVIIGEMMMEEDKVVGGPSGILVTFCLLVWMLVALADLCG